MHSRWQLVLLIILATSAHDWRALADQKWKPPRAADLGWFLVEEVPRAFPALIHFLNDSASFATLSTKRYGCRHATCIREAMSCRSGVFRNAVWGMITRTLLPEDSDVGGSAGEVQWWGGGCEEERAEDLDRISPLECRVHADRRTALRAFKSRGDVFICWLEGGSISMCCGVGCVGSRNAEQAAPLREQVNRCCRAELTTTLLAEPCSTRCLAARSLMPIWFAIASWRRFSQGNQDAVLSFLLSQLGIASRFFVEIGFNQPDWQNDESGPNTKMLHESGWHGLMFDNRFENPSIGLHKHEVTMANVADLLTTYGAPLEPDYVSIDIDGCDLWVFLGLTKRFRPRVVSIEYNANWPLGDLRTVDCASERASGVSAVQESFECLPSMLGPGTFENICGASLAAIARAAELRGYTLVWVEPLLDAYLVRSDLVCKGEEPDLSEFAYAVNLTVHSPSMDPTRAGRWLVDFGQVAALDAHWF